MAPRGWSRCTTNVALAAARGRPDERPSQQNARQVGSALSRRSRQNRSKLFERKRDAAIFDGRIRERKALGELAMLDAGRETLDHYVNETWRPVHTAPLAESTRREYARIYRLHVEPRLGDLPLRAIEVEIVERYQADLIAAGVGPHARHKAMALLGSIMQRAFEARRVPSNQVRLCAPRATARL